ncbi:DASH complex subunit ASK1 [Pseudohyphozyma bogoriensis]|nr:DASH complex subunit ASK1 [Pseudohyphozyma bogoriensis]
MAGRRGVFYDAANPRMLTEEEIHRLTPQDCQAACDQIDQNLVGVLQEIDECLSQADLIVNLRLLPAVQKYGENSQQIWESVKFWKMFFEASANTKLNEPYTGDESVHSAEPSLGAIGSTGESVAGDADRSLAFDQDASIVSGAALTDAGGTPRPSKQKDHQWSDDLNPFQALNADLEKIGIHSSAESNSSMISQTTRDIVNARGSKDVVPDSPEMVLPEFETIGNLERLGKGKERAFDFAPESPGLPRLRAGADKLQPGLLQKVLQRNMASPRPPGASTPAKGARARFALPDELPKGWNGIADISTTPLSAFSFASPLKRPEATTSASAAAPSEISTSSPPRGIPFSLPRAPFSQTPAKEAARRVARDVYADSPMASPPSVVKAFAARRSMMPIPQPSPAESRRGFEEEAFEDDDEEDLYEMPKVKGALAEFGGGTTARIDDLLNESSFAKVVDDESDAFARVVDDDNEGHPRAYEDDYGGEESYALQDELSGELGPAGPEDTLFGLPQARQQAHPHGDTDDSFEGASQAQFRVLGMSDLDTLHGGVLLESEPFEASPLAGRNR